MGWGREVSEVTVVAVDVIAVIVKVVTGRCDAGDSISEHAMS